MAMVSSKLAEEERKNIKQRQAEGIAIAKKNGKHLGRPRLTLNSLTKEQRAILEALYLKWVSHEITAVEFMSKLNLKKNTFYKIIKEFQAS